MENNHVPEEKGRVLMAVVNLGLYHIPGNTKLMAQLVVILRFKMQIIEIINHHRFLLIQVIKQLGGYTEERHMMAVLLAVLR